MITLACHKEYDTINKIIPICFPRYSNVDKYQISSAKYFISIEKQLEISVYFQVVRLFALYFQ